MEWVGLALGVFSVAWGLFLYDRAFRKHGVVDERFLNFYAVAGPLMAILGSILIGLFITS